MNISFRKFGISPEQESDSLRLVAIIDDSRNWHEDKQNIAEVVKEYLGKKNIDQAELKSVRQKMYQIVKTRGSDISHLVNSTQSSKDIKERRKRAIDIIRESRKWAQEKQTWEESAKKFYGKSELSKDDKKHFQTFVLRIKREGYKIPSYEHLSERSKRGDIYSGVMDFIEEANKSFKATGNRTSWDEVHKFFYGKYSEKGSNDIAKLMSKIKVYNNSLPKSKRVNLDSIGSRGSKSSQQERIKNLMNVVNRIIQGPKSQRNWKSLAEAYYTKKGFDDMVSVSKSKQPMETVINYVRKAIIDNYGDKEYQRISDILSRKRFEWEPKKLLKAIKQVQKEMPSFKMGPMSDGIKIERVLEIAGMDVSKHVRPEHELKRKAEKLGIDKELEKLYFWGKDRILKALKQANSYHAALVLLHDKGEVRNMGKRYETLSNKLKQYGLLEIAKKKFGKGMKIKPRLEEGLKGPEKLSDFKKQPLNQQYTINYLKDNQSKTGVEYKCNGANNQGCGLTDEYNGYPLTLQLDHINGISWDNRLKNLRFICPTCHTQTETYGAKNIKNVKDQIKKDQIKERTSSLMTYAGDKEQSAINDIISLTVTEGFKNYTNKLKRYLKDRGIEEGKDMCSECGIQGKWRNFPFELNAKTVVKKTKEGYKKSLKMMCGNCSWQWKQGLNRKTKDDYGEKGDARPESNDYEDKLKNTYLLNNLRGKHPEKLLRRLIPKVRKMINKQIREMDASAGFVVSYRQADFINSIEEISSRTL